jgi:hypothetical protein
VQQTAIDDCSGSSLCSGRRAAVGFGCRDELLKALEQLRDPAFAPQASDPKRVDAEMAAQLAGLARRSAPNAVA